MSGRITSAALVGLDAVAVDVEADLSNGLPNFTIVGLPDPAVQEARERVRSAIRHAGIQFPRNRVTVNLAPADLRKEGGGYDLPIALAIILAENIVPAGASSAAVVIGELSLHGEVRPITGALSVALSAHAAGRRTVFLPAGNAAEAAVVPGLDIRPVETLAQLVGHLRGDAVIPSYTATFESPILSFGAVDFTAIHGQAHAKRALEVAAAGGHNVLFAGPPGAGKTLLAKAFASVLPPLSLSESIEVTRIYSVAGLLPPGATLVRTRPFRSPHHTASAVALVGGGTNPRPGEISLAHRGVLFLDELPEFSRAVLEALRQPLEDGVVTVSRASGTIRFPATFTLLASQNPCPCGFAGDPTRACTCQPSQVLKYGKRISGPLKDRIDLHVSVPAVPIRELTGSVGESSAAIRPRVEAARKRQVERFDGIGIFTNSEIPPSDMKRFCVLDSAADRFLERAAASFHFSARSYHRLLKVSRTIADLYNEDVVRADHVAEAVQYRLRTDG